MTNNGIINIHGKDYMTVARRVELAQEAKALDGVETEVLNRNPVVVKAKVTIRGKVFTGISSVNLQSHRQIEKQNPYEVAETSAVGRALGFAGYGLIESIASADEMIRAGHDASGQDRFAPSKQVLPLLADQEKPKAQATCEVCGAPATEKKGVSKSGRQYHGIFCSTADRSHTRWLWN
jgi:hypothetical protein